MSTTGNNPVTVKELMTDPGQQQVSVVVDSSVHNQPAQLVQGPDGQVYVILQDGRTVEAVFDAPLQQEEGSQPRKDPKVINLGRLKPAASSPSPTTDHKVGDKCVSRAALSQLSTTNNAEIILEAESRGVKRGADSAASAPAAKQRSIPVTTTDVPVVTPETKYNPPTPDELRSLNVLTSGLFESMTGFKGLIVSSLHERLIRTRHPTYQINGDKMGPLPEKIRLFLIRVRTGMRYEALSELFNLEIASAQRFCREISELFHYGVEQKKLASLATTVRKAGNVETECSGKAVIEIQTEIPYDPAERFHFYSPKNKMHTVKFLVAIGPDGSIVFVSNAYRGNTTDDTLVQDCGVQSFLTKNLPDSKALPFIKTAVKTMKRFEVLHFVPADFLPEMDGILPVVAHLAKYFPAQIYNSLNFAK